MVAQRACRRFLARQRVDKMREAAVAKDEVMLRESWQKIEPNLQVFASLLFNRMLEVDVDLRCVGTQR